MREINVKWIICMFFAGFCVGVTIGTAVSTVVSYCIGENRYIAVMPQLSANFKNEINAVLIQNILCGFIGALFAESSLIFFTEKPSFLTQCIIHFAVTAIFYLPFVYLCYTPIDLKTVMFMLFNILFSYALTWLLQYRRYKKNIKMLNKKISEARNNVGN